MRGHAFVLAVVVARVSWACGGGTIGGDDDGDPPGDASQPGDSNPVNDTQPPRDVPGGVGEPANLAGITLAHNQVRNMVQTSNPLPFLTWSDDLAATAAAWAAQCIDQDAPAGLIDHNDGRSTGHPYYVGENIFGSGGTATAQQAVASWASESANYTYATNSCAQGKICGHYTQLVWRATLEVGCALQECNSLSFGSTIVCNYGPGGNSSNLPPY